MVSFPPGLTSLSARPPTPPKESSSRLANDHDTGLHSTIANRPLVDTPDESPSSSAENFKGLPERAHKKVEFSPWTDFHRFPVSASRDSDSEGSIRRLPPSKECRSVKSILKACSANTTFLSDTEMLAFDQTSLLGMLRTTSQHLANPLRASRLDAYSALFASLSAYDEVPESKNLSEKVVEIIGHIRRDVSAKLEADGSLDTQLVTQAIKVLTVFLCTPSLAVSFPDDFCTFILDRSISSIEDAESPKILISHYMHLLEKQKFTSKYMTTDRVNRLLSALDGVTSRTKGNRIVCHRLMIYQRLLLQSKSVMAARAANWIDNMISGMLSSIKDIRVRAIGFGVEAGLQMGMISSVSQTFVEICNRRSSEGTKVVDYLCTHLVDMAVSKEDGIHVPQIWSVVILFLRSRRRQLECWEHIKAWIVVIQRCLNSGDPQVKFQANIAWSRLIFVVNPDTSTSNSMIKMLRQPMVSQLERKANDKNAKQAKQIARSTYCTLLYYAFRPTATHAQLNQYWDAYVAQILPSSFVVTKSDVNHAFDILAALLSPSGKIWDENRANMNGPVKPEELPYLDPKWIRSQANKIALLFDKLFDLADWRLGEDREASVLLAWRSFMTALGIASSKEVRVSTDTMKALSTVINQVKRLLDRRHRVSQGREVNEPGRPNEGEKSDIYLKIGILVQEAVAKIGTIPFMERRLILTSQDAFEAAETPSSRSTRDTGSLDSPSMHLLKLLLRSLQDQQPTSSYISTVKAVMHITLQSTTNRRAQFIVIRQVARLLSTDTVLDKGANLVLWHLLAEATSVAIVLPQHNDTHNASPQHPGQEYREAVKILELGIQQRSVKTIDAWKKLHDCIAASIRNEVCDDGVVLMMTESVADIIRKYSDVCDEALLVPAAILLRDAHWPQSHQSVERAQKLLWGAVHASHRSTSLSHFHSLWSMVDTLLGNAYGLLTTLDAESIRSLLSAVIVLIGSCPPEYQGTVLAQSQPGLAAWIEDAGGKLSSSISPLLTGVFLTVDKLWAAILTMVEKRPNHDTRLLFSTQHLLLPGLKSRHKSILNQAIVIWNRTFGCAESLEYPEELRNMLFKLQTITDIQLPTFPAAEMNEAMSSSPIHFVDSQENGAGSQNLLVAKLPEFTDRSLRVARTVPKPLVCSPSPKSNAKSPLSARQGIKTTPKVTLRHNDSQIQFAAIESSPLAPEPIDSQYLTDRQREVKERQGLEAAMFPEIRSSPKSASRPADYTLPKLVFKTTGDPGPKPAVDEQTSPMYPPDILMNEFLGSSPTPASSKKGTNGMGSLDGPPSSPPSVSSPLGIKRRIIEPPTSDSRHEAVTGTENRISTELLDQSLSNIEKASNSVGELGVHPKDLPTSARAALQTEDRIMSDLDVFMDAPSELTENLPEIVQWKDLSTVRNPSPKADSSHSTSEDDQVTAQLVREMERASSQHSNKQVETEQPRSRAPNKRKDPFGEDASAPKRVRSIPSSSDLPQHVQTSAAGQAVAECVMIEVRPGYGKPPLSPLHIKKERSQSPSGIADISPAEKSPVAGKRLGQSRGKSRSSQISQKALSLPNSLRQSQATPGSDVNEPSTARKTQGIAREPARRKSALASNPSRPATSTPENAALASGSLTTSGKRKASKYWYYTTEEPHVEDVQTIFRAKASRSNEDVARIARRHSGPSRSPASEQQQPARGQQDRSGAGAPDKGNEAPTSNQGDERCQPEVAADVGTSVDPPTAEGIVAGFKRMLSNIKRVTLGREDEREISKLLFQSVAEVHEAGRRHTAM